MKKIIFIIISIMLTSCSTDNLTNKVKNKVKNFGNNPCYDKATNTVKLGCKKD